MRCFRPTRWHPRRAGTGPAPRAARNVRTFGDLIDLHDEDMHEVGKPPRPSKTNRTNLRQLIPMGRIVRYAVATTFQRVRQRTVHGAGERILLVGALQCQRHDAACHLGLDVFGHKILLQATARAGTLTSAPSRKPVRRCRMICSASVMMRSINSFTEGMS